MKTRKILELGLAAVMIVPALAFAQTLYKQVRPDGSIIYSDKPVPGTEILDMRDIPPPPPPPPAGEQRARPSSQPGVGSASEGKPKPKTEQPTRGAWDAANDEVLAAQKALDDAKRQRDEGQEPKPGERLGIAKGGSRLSEAYEERLRALDQAVTDAEARLQRAYEARSAARY